MSYTNATSAAYADRAATWTGAALFYAVGLALCSVTGLSPAPAVLASLTSITVFLAAATQPYGQAIWAGLFAFVGMATLISTGVITSKMLATSYAASWWIAGPLLPLLLLPAVYNFISLVTSLKKSNNASAADRHEL